MPATDLAAKPATADHLATATLPLGGLTAWQALIDHARHIRGKVVIQVRPPHDTAIETTSAP